jgi:protein SCO1/2
MALAVGASAALPADVRFEQRIGQQLPMDEVFTDENGRTQPLDSYLGGKPAVLIFNYLRCPEICSLVADGTVDALRQLKPSVGRDFVVISVSIDPTDTVEMARSHQREQARLYGRTGASSSWHSLVGKPSAIGALAAAAGFHYWYDARSRQYAHPSGIVLVTPRGVVSSYFLGVDFPAPQVAPALRRAAENKTGSSVFSLLFICFQGGSPEGRYGALIWTILSASVALTVATVFGGILWLLRAERADRSAGEGSA